MKRLFTFLLAVALLLNLAGCQQPDFIQILSPTTPSTEGTEATTHPTIPTTQEPTELPTIQSPTEETTAPTDPTESTPTEPVIQPPTVLPEPDDEDFVRIVDYIPTARVELPYATANNFTGYRIYDFTDSYLRYGTVKKLMKVSEELAEQGIGLIIWDGFRPAAAQAKLWEICPDPTFVSHPVTGKRTHCRGNTVDISLYDLETGEDLPVPTGYDNFTAYADRDYSDCSKDAATNARLLEQTMEKYGFTPYFAEWWHFADTKDYPIDEFFNPAIPTTWSANCNEYISLRSTPGGEVIAKIPKGATMELQSWDGKYAEVSYKGMTGYVLTNYIMPEDDSYFDECLDTVQPTNVYSYEQMVADMEQLQKQYSVIITGRKHHGIDIQIVQHSGNGDLGMKFFKHENRVTGISIKLRHTSGCVIGNAADIFHRMFIEDASGLAGAAVAIKIMYFHITKNLPKRRIANILTKLINIPTLKCITGIQCNNFCIGQSILHMLDHGSVSGTLFVRFTGHHTKLLERTFHTGISFIGAFPLSIFTDIFPILKAASFCRFNMGNGKPILDGTEPDRRCRVQEDVDMIGPGGRNFSSQAEVIRMEQIQQFNDLLYGQPMFFRVVYDEHPFSGLRVFYIGHRFLSPFATATSLA